MKQPFTLLIALISLSVLAQVDIAVPINNNEIPISGQSFAVLVIGYLLGKKWGAVCIVLYIVLGGLGLPIFADGGSGFKTLAGGSGGYLYGFILAAYIAGMLNEKGWNKNFFQCVFVMTIGTIVILFFGLMQLTFKYGFFKALEYGLYPFIPGAIIKILLGAAVVYWFHIWKNKGELDKSQILDSE